MAITVKREAVENPLILAGGANNFFLYYSNFFRNWQPVDDGCLLSNDLLPLPADHAVGLEEAGNTLDGSSDLFVCLIKQTLSSQQSDFRVLNQRFD